MLDAEQVAVSPSTVYRVAGDLRESRTEPQVEIVLFAGPRAVPRGPASDSFRERTPVSRQGLQAVHPTERKDPCANRPVLSPAQRQEGALAAIGQDRRPPAAGAAVPGRRPPYRDEVGRTRQYGSAAPCARLRHAPGQTGRTSPTDLRRPRRQAGKSPPGPPRRRDGPGSVRRKYVARKKTTARGAIALTLRKSRREAPARRRPRCRCVAADWPGRRLRKKLREPGAFLEGLGEGPWRTCGHNGPSGATAPRGRREPSPQEPANTGLDKGHRGVHKAKVNPANHWLR